MEQHHQKAADGFQSAVARKLEALSPAAAPAHQPHHRMPRGVRMQEQFAARREYAPIGYEGQPHPYGAMPMPPAYESAPIVPPGMNTVAFESEQMAAAINGPFHLPTEAEADPELRQTHNTIPFDEQSVGLRGMDAENEKLYRSLGEGFAKVAESDERLDKIVQANYRRQAARYQNVLLKDLIGLLNEIAGLISKRRLYVETLIRNADSFQDPEGSRALIGELQLLNAEWKRLDEFKCSTVDKAEALRTAVRSDLQGAYSAQREFDEKSAERLALAQKDAARFEFEKEKYEHQVADYTAEIQTINTRLAEKRRRTDELLALLREVVPSLPGDATEARHRRDMLRADVERLRQDADDFASRRHELEVRARNAAAVMTKKRDAIAASKADLEALRNEQLDSARLYLSRLADHERARKELEVSLQTPNHPAFEALHTAKNYIKARELELNSGMRGQPVPTSMPEMYPQMPGYDPTYFARADALSPSEGEERSRLYLEDVAFDLIRDNCAAILLTLKEEIKRKREQLDNVVKTVNSQADAEAKKIDTLVAECSTGLTDNIWDRRGMADDVKTFLNEKRGEIDMAMFAVSKQREDAFGNNAELAALQLVTERLDQLKQYVDYQLTQIAVGGTVDFSQINHLQAEINAAKARIREDSSTPSKPNSRHFQTVREAVTTETDSSVDGRLDRLRRIFARIDAEEKKINDDIDKFEQTQVRPRISKPNETIWRQTTTKTTTQQRRGAFDRELEAMNSTLDEKTDPTI